MKRSFTLLLFAFLPGLLNADSVSCTVDNAPAPCSATGFNPSPININYSVAKGSFTASVNTNLIGVLPPDGPMRETYTARYDDTFYLPPAPAGDVYKVNILASDVPSNPPYYGYGYGGSSFIQLRSESIYYDPGLDGASPGVCINHGCFFNGTLPANQVTYLEFIGGLDAAVRPGMTVGAGDSANITLDLFKADGVTPDVFTPEPASFSLFALTAVMAVGWVLHRKRKAA